MMLARPSESAPSVPGRTRSQRSALLASPTLRGSSCVDDARKRRIIAPQDETAGFANVCQRAASASGRNAANAENIACRKTRSPAAQVKVRYLVGRTESVHQSAHED